MTNDIIKTPLEKLLDSVDYSYLSDDYVPSQFALDFCNFFKTIDPYADDTPPFHYAMLDKFNSGNKFHANLCHRGAAKTTVMGIRLLIWLAIFGELPGKTNICNAIYISDSIDNGVKTLRKNLQSLYDKSQLLRDLLPTFNLTETYLSCVNADGRSFDAKFFGVMTGIRGTQINNQRPYVAIMDDLVSDKNAASKAYMKTVNEVVYGGIMPAMHPAWSRVIFLGTPFSHDDVIVKAVSSGKWDCSVYPIAEKWPCTEEEFKGSWPSRFSFKYISDVYDINSKTGNAPYFFREYMLRLGSADAVMVPLEQLNFYDKEDYVEGQCNFIITTDFAYTEKQSADASVISVWAVTPHNNLCYVDGCLRKQTMDKSMDDLIEYCQRYNPIKVGIEVTGQQGAIVSWFRKRMQEIDTWWPVASNQKNGDLGIRPTTDKLARFMEVAPWLRSGKVLFPQDWENSHALREGLKQIISTTSQGIVTADDFLDTVSMLTQVPFYPLHDHLSRNRDMDTLVRLNQDDVFVQDTYNAPQFKETARRNYLA